MLLDKAKIFLKKYWLFYLTGLLIVVGLKYFYSKAGSEELGWILAPTAWWVQALSGIPFKKEIGIGFVNHDYRFIIAPSCAGINFLIITFATLLFSLLQRVGERRARFLWIAVSLGLSYLFTVLINGLRIIVSIYILRLDIYNGWITPERVHMVEGTVIYFASLLIIYTIIGEALNHLYPESSSNRKDGRTPAQMTAHKSPAQMLSKCIPPLFWYILITLGIPLLNRAYRNDSPKFIEHTIMLSAVCLAVNLIFLFTFVLNRHKKANCR